MADTSTKQGSGKHLFFLIDQTRRCGIIFVERKTINQGVLRHPDQRGPLKMVANATTSSEECTQAAGSGQFSRAITSDGLERSQQHPSGRTILVAPSSVKMSPDGLERTQQHSLVGAERSYRQSNALIPSDELERNRQKAEWSGQNTSLVRRGGMFRSVHPFGSNCIRVRSQSEASVGKNKPRSAFKCEDIARRVRAQSAASVRTARMCVIRRNAARSWEVTAEVPSDGLERSRKPPSKKTNAPAQQPGQYDMAEKCPDGRECVKQPPSRMRGEKVWE